MNNKKFQVIGLATLLFITLFASGVLASAEEIPVEMWFSSHPTDVVRYRVTEVEAGRSLWIVVQDPDRNIDPAKRDTIRATEIMVINPNTYAMLNPLWLGQGAEEGRKYYRFLKETGKDTNIFVLPYAIIIGDRAEDGTHIMGGEVELVYAPGPPHNMWIEGNWIYDPFYRGIRTQLMAEVGRFEDGDTLIGIYRSVRDDSDTAVAMVQLARTEATIKWCELYYRPIGEGGWADITVYDLDENLNPHKIEYVPIFIIVNPGTWNPVQLDPNHPPIAVDDHHTTPMDEPLIILAAEGVLANDIDPDPDEDLLTVELVTEPAGGEVVLHPDGSFTYTPKLGFFGTDSFTYRATDIHGASDEATVWITVTHPDINHPPIAVDDAYAVYIGDAPLNTRVREIPGVLANDFDPDGDNVVEAVLVRDVPDDHALILAPGGSFIYTPPPGFTGIVSFTYRAVDEHGGISAEATVTITVNLDPTFPNAVDDNYVVFVVFIDHILTVFAPGVLANDDFGAQTVSQITLVREPTYGTVIDLKPDGSFRYLPKPGFVGEDSFTYRVYDDINGHDEATVTINVIPLPVNISPIATKDEYATVMNTVLTIDAPGVLANDSDSNDDVLEAVLYRGPYHGTLHLHLDGSFTYTPKTDFVGEVYFTYRARDVHGAYSYYYATVTITVGALRQQAQSRTSAANFQMLLRYGGVHQDGTPVTCDAGTYLHDLPRPVPIRWHNIFDDRFIMYPITVEAPNLGREFAFQIMDRPNWGPGVVRVLFLAEETGKDTGVFELELRNIEAALGFRPGGLESQYVLAAFYVDPNDFSDVAIAVAYALGAPPIRPIVDFVDTRWEERDYFALGRDRVNVRVSYGQINRNRGTQETVVVQIFSPHSADREWLILYEDGTNVPDFRGRALGLQSVWDAAGDGFLMEPVRAVDRDFFDIGNKDLNTFNRSAVIVRFNAVEVASYPTKPNIITAWHDERRVVFDEMEIRSTLVFDRKAGLPNMWFIDAAGERVTGYTIGEAVFIEIFDPDQNENILWRDRIDPRWATQGVPPFPVPDIHDDPRAAMIFIANPRIGKWTPIELRETGPNTNYFRSIEPVSLVEHLDARTDDTILAFYQDPSDHSDVAVISIRVVAVVNHPPVAVDDTYEMLMDDILTIVAPGVLANDTDQDNDDRTAEVVTEPAHGILDLRPDGSFTYTPNPGFVGEDSFVYRALDGRGGVNEATVTITVKEEVVEEILEIDDFIVVHELSSRFSFVGTGVAETFRLTIFNMLGRKVRELEEFNVGPGDLVIWDGRDVDGVLLAKGPYIFVAVLTGADDVVFTIRGTVFRK